MTAKELMIGDWVKVLPISRKIEAHNSQVGALTRNVDNTISIEGGYFPSWQGWSVGEEYIEPIPLTEEIATVNGIPTNGDACPIDGGEGRYIELIWEDGTLFWSINFAEYLVMPLHYVHELQHALRLCGLSEFADNFKVKQP